LLRAARKHFWKLQDLCVRRAIDRIIKAADALSGMIRAKQQRSTGGYSRPTATGRARGGETRPTARAKGCRCGPRKLSRSVFIRDRIQTWIFGGPHRHVRYGPPMGPSQYHTALCLVRQRCF
jgi:hypothetical protein